MLRSLRDPVCHGAAVWRAGTRCDLFPAGSTQCGASLCVGDPACPYEKDKTRTILTNERIFASIFGIKQRKDGNK